jgi:hypothetical protein
MAFPFTVIDVPQRSPEWFAARLGRLTGSVAAEMMANPRKGATESVQRRNLRVRLALERLTGRSLERSFTNGSMERGIEKEADAIAAYEARTGMVVRPCGFVSLNDSMVGTSPDGVIGDFVGVVEAKCPDSPTHLTYLRDNRIPPDYQHQLIHTLYVTDAEYCDFVSFDDRMPEGLELFVKRLWLHDVDTDAYALAVKLFLAEVEQEIADINKLRAGVAA